MPGVNAPEESVQFSDFPMPIRTHEVMNIVIIGLGYVGLTTAGCLCLQGHFVTGIDVSSAKIKELQSGRLPIMEPGLDDALLGAILKGQFRFSARLAAELLETADVVIVCVGTPGTPEGSHDMTRITEVSTQLAEAFPVGRSLPLPIVYRSTFRPGTMEQLVKPIFEQRLAADIERIELVYNPEFLRESTAIADYFNPPKVVIGTADGQECSILTTLYAEIPGERFLTRYREAELVKFVDNTFHALKVSFANEIGRICLKNSIDSKVIHRIFVSDTKLNISPYYLRPGGAFGGSCLPKDVRALQKLSADCEASTPLIDSLIASNERHKAFLLDLCKQHLDGRSTVLVVGLAFKTNTDDLRESPNVDLARELLEAGHELRIFDANLSMAHIKGRNLGWLHEQIPHLPSLLIDERQLPDLHFDLLVDTNGLGTSLNAKYRNYIDINAL